MTTDSARQLMDEIEDLIDHPVLEREVLPLARAQHDEIQLRLSMGRMIPDRMPHNLKSIRNILRSGRSRRDRR